MDKTQLKGIIENEIKLKNLMLDNENNKKYILTIGKNIQTIKQNFANIENVAPELFKKSSKSILELEKKLTTLSNKIDANILKLQTNSDKSLEIKTNKLSKEFQNITNIIYGELASIKNIIDKIPEIKDGNDGKGIDKIYLDKSNLIVLYTDGSKEDVGRVIPSQDVLPGKRGPGSTLTVFDTLTSDNASNPLSANQGRILKALIDAGGGGGGGTGDMTKAVYDTNNNGIVDNAEKVNSHTVDIDVPSNAVFTDTIYTLPVASTSLGGVKSGTDITVDGTGNVSVVDDSHNHITSNIDGLDTTLSGIASSIATLNKTSELEKDPTGFTNNSDITVTYDSTTRKITLAGTFEAYFNGVLVPELTNGWVSNAHPETLDVTYFLYYNGTNFIFSDIAWTFDQLQIAYVQYGTAHKIALKETHGFMDWKAHREFHYTIGSYKTAGGTLTAGSYALNSTTLADRRPLVDATTMFDEDLMHVINAKVSETYTQKYFVGNSVRTLVADASDIVYTVGNNAYYNQNVSGTWQQTVIPNGNYASIFCVAIPCTADANSQKYRYIWAQPQSTGSLLSQELLSHNDIYIGEYAMLVSEFVPIIKVIIRQLGGNWTIQEVQVLAGTKYNSTSSSAGNYLSTVATDTTLAGDGTALNPLTSKVGIAISLADTKATPIDADLMVVSDTEATNVAKKFTVADFKAVLKTYFDTLYNLYVHPTGDGNLHVPATSTTNNGKVLTAGATAGSLSWGTPSSTAEAITYDNTNSGLTATEVQSAIDELANELDTATQESCIVTVSTSDAQSVAGQVITLHNVTASTTEEYTLLTAETSHTFKIPQSNQYYIAVSAKPPYTTPAQSSTFTALGNNIRNVSMQYALFKRYGFRRTKAESNPDARIVYQFDAVGLTPAYMNFTSGSFDYGSWQTFINDVSRPVMLKTDGTVDYELSRTNMTKKVDGVTASDIANTAYDGNAMIEFREYIWVQRYEDATYEYVTFADGQYDSTYKSYATTNALGNVKDTFYWGVCKGTNVSSKLRSIGTGAIMASQTRNTEVSYATANGSGYYTIYKSGWDFIGDLLTLITRSDNSQAKFGNGRNNTSSALPAGTMNAQPYFKGYTDVTSDVKVFGIEGFWGNVWEGMAGFVYNGNIKTKMTPPYNFDGSGYTDTGLDPSGTSGGFTNTASVTDVSGYVPKTASGSATTYYCDGLWFNTAQVDYAIVSGSWADASHDGARCVYLNDLPSFVHVALGSRLSFLNPA
jgi:hypothetical protein